MSDDPTTPPAAPSTWDEVRRLADEVRLKVHLAGMELKDKWKALEPELLDVENKLVAAGEKVEGVISPRLDALAAGLRKVVDDLRKTTDKTTDAPK